MPMSVLRPREAVPVDLAGKVILLTGVTGGLGGAVVRKVVAAGASVVLTGRKVRHLEKLYDALKSLGGAGELLIHPLDLEAATPTDYEALADGIAAEFGRLDGLVHAAVHFGGLTPLSVHKPDDFLRAQQVNVAAPFALTQACLPLLARADDSAVVFVLDNDELLERAHWGGYGVSKAALARLAAIFHDEHDKAALRVHAVLPGPMRTALRREAYFGEDTLQQPLPDDAADAIVQLLAPAGAYARGAVLDLRH
jgi:NAD(P)-dependent dehydrogenase (short-subunit alcohol dehydrogenase family)